jgi:hypothetical protein
MDMPPRLGADLDRARQSGQVVDVVPDGTRFLIILRAYRLPDGYVPSEVDLMVMADYLYPMSAMDMFWTSPVVYCASGNLPQNADQMETYAGMTWQRWSWHYTGWNPNSHDLLTHFDVVRDRLRRAC